MFIICFFLLSFVKYLKFYSGLVIFTEQHPNVPAIEYDFVYVQLIEEDLVFTACI